MTEGWRQYLDEMEDAIASGQAAAAVRAWHRAHAAVIDHPGWQPIVRVAEAARRIGAISGFARAAEARARETYWIALFRAHREGSLEGVLETAEGFGALGDRNMVEQCIRIAEGLATRAGHESGHTHHVRSVAADLMRRYFDAPIEREARSPA
jgi:hypothetical protein